MTEEAAAQPLVGVSSSIPAKANPLSRAALDVSTSFTGTPALFAATNAIPRPLFLLEWRSIASFLL